MVAGHIELTAVLAYAVCNKLTDNVHSPAVCSLHDFVWLRIADGPEPWTLDKTSGPLEQAFRLIPS